MSYNFTDYNQMVGKRPRQTYWQELQDAVVALNEKIDGKLLTSQLNIVPYKRANEILTSYQKGITAFQVIEDVNSGYPSLDGIVETVYINEFRNIQHFFDYTEDNVAGSTYYRQWKPSIHDWTPWNRLSTTAELEEHTQNIDVHLTPLDRNRIQGYSHYQPSVSNTWDIVHGLNKYPSVTIVDSGGNTVVGDVRYVSLNEVQVTFTSAFSGTAYLN